MEDVKWKDIQTELVTKANSLKFFTDLVDNQVDYLETLDRFPVALLVNHNGIAKLVEAVFNTETERSIALNSLSTQVGLMFYHKGLPVYYNPKLTKMDVMVVAEPRYWK